VSSVYISLACPWPTNADGTAPATDALLEAAALDRIAAFTDHDRLTACIDDMTGDTPQSYVESWLCTDDGPLGLDGQGVELTDLTTDQVWAYATSVVQQELARMWASLADHEFDLYHDGVRWFATAGGVSCGDYPSETMEALSHLCFSGIFEAPVDGGEFIDMAAVAAALAVTEHVIARTEAALLRSNPTPEALAAAKVEWAQLRNDLVPTGRLIRSTMAAVTH